MTEKRKQQRRAAQARYSVTPKGRATTRRYRTSAKGRASDVKGNARLLRAGVTYLGKARTPEQGLMIKQHIKEKLLEFTSSQRAEASAHAAEI